MVKIGYMCRLLVGVVCYMLFDLLLFVICYLLSAVCYLLSVNCLTCCLLSIVAKNDLEFDDKLWPSDDEVAPNDGYVAMEYELVYQL
jgi:hypothetical protein